MSTVLIETLWNVKLYVFTVSASPALSINRNIVECKVLCISLVRVCSWVLIETLWNVKLYSVAIRLKVAGINRNIVECKVFLGVLPVRSSE